MSERHASALAPWAGMLLGFLGWAIGQQTGNLLVPWSCRIGFALPVLATGLACALVAGAGGVVSWRVWREGGNEDLAKTRVRRFIAALCVGLAALFLLAILGQTAAGLVFTGCEQ